MGWEGDRRLGWGVGARARVGAGALALRCGAGRPGAGGRYGQAWSGHER